jgi:hypothetical protein
VDTVASPFELMEPKDWNRLYNTITLDSENASKDHTVTMTVDLVIGADDSPLRMKNQVDLSVTLPSTTVSLEVLASMRESSLLNFPLSDATNIFCKVAALESWSPESEGGQEPGPSTSQKKSSNFEVDDDLEGEMERLAVSEQMLQNELAGASIDAAMSPKFDNLACATRHLSRRCRQDKGRWRSRGAFID